MTKEEQLIDELSKMPPMVIATAYLYAINYTRYGVDVTKDWVTATQNASALEKAYIEGYHDAMEKKPKTGHWIKSIIYENIYNCSKCGSEGYGTFNYCPNCGVKMESEAKDGKID